jgi:hypothetical protein
LNFINRMATRHGLVRAGVPAAAQAHRVFERALIAGLWDQELATSVGVNLRSVRLAAASVRERLSPEHWRLLEQAESRFFQLAKGPGLAQPAPDALPDTVAVQRLLADTSQMLAALTGAQTERMSRDDGWRLLSVGRHIERLEFLSHALSEAVQLGLIEEQAGFDAVLDLFDSTISFHAQYQQSRTPQALVGWMAAAGLGVAAFLLLYVLLILLLGTIIDSSSIMLIVLPLMLPIAQQFELNLIWFGVITVVAVEVGLLTPPFGLSAYVIKSTLGNSVDVSLGDIFRGTAPFTLAMLVVLALLIAFPSITLVLLK